MCGIVSYSGPKNFNKKKIKLLLAWNSLERGEDATGLYTPKNGLHKKLERGSEFILHEDNDFAEDKLFIGHVRAKTVGTNIVENAHPFQRDNYILAHNGTLKNHYALLRKYELVYADYNVDSDILCGSIAKSKSFYPIKEIDGPAALVMHDTNNPEILYVFKNADRPLFRGTDEQGNMYISSIDEPLYYLELHNIRQFKDNILYTIKNGAIIKTTPYKNEPVVSVVTTPTATSRSNISTYEIDYYNDLWIRARITATTHNADSKLLNVIKDKYYLAVKSAPTGIEVVTENGIQGFVPKQWLDHTDVITNESYVICLDDQVLSRSTATRDQIVANKGDVFKVYNVFWDKDLGLNSLKTKQYIGSYVDKKSFRKLNTEEFTKLLVELYPSASLNPTTITVPVTTIPFDMTPPKVGNNAIFPFLKQPASNPKNISCNVQNRNLDEEMQQEHFVTNFLYTLDDALETINGLAVVSGADYDLQLKIEELMDFVTKNSEIFLDKTITD